MTTLGTPLSGPPANPSPVARRRSGDAADARSARTAVAAPMCGMRG
ncbi:hypothetical protein [Planctomonas psychrotolerans]|nr:hypothetical protein [Planctomonas psychrotolerans]